MANEDWWRRDLAPGAKLQKVIEGPRGILGLAWAPQAPLLAVGSYATNQVLLYDAESGQQRAAIAVPDGLGLGWGLGWSPDGQQLAIGTAKGGVEIWSGDSTRHLQRFTAGPEWAEARIYRLVWAPDGNRLAGIAYNSNGRAPLLIWGLQRGKRRVVQIPDEDVAALAWAPDGTRLAFGTRSGRLGLLDIASGQYRWSVERHQGWIHALIWRRGDAQTGGADQLITASDDRTIGSWSIIDDRPALQTRLEGHTNGVMSIALSPDGQLLASLSYNYDLQLHRWPTRELLLATGPAPDDKHGAWPSFLAFHPSRPLLAATHPDWASISLWHVDTAALLKVASAAPAIVYSTAKIVLLGASGVGKSGLGYRLATDQFKELASTHGQQFWRLDQLQTTRADGTEREAILWDLAGQPDYRILHALFIGDADIALLLFDAAEQVNPLQAVEYWLQALPHDRTRCPVLLVGARVDRGQPSLTPAALDSFCQQHQIMGWLLTSAMSGEGIADFAARLKALIAAQRGPTTTTTTLFKVIKEAVLALRGAPDAPVLLSPDAFRSHVERATGFTFTDAELLTATGHLANHGFVALLRRPSGERSILLQPDLLNNLGASFILAARTEETGRGKLHEGRLRRGEYRFQELQGLPTATQEQLLDAAVAHFLAESLCFRHEEGQESYLIFPALINQTGPGIDATAQERGDAYRVTGAVEHLYGKLVTQLGHTGLFARIDQWQNQAEYTFKRTEDSPERCGLYITARQTGLLDLTLYYDQRTDAPTRQLFQQLCERYLQHERQVQLERYPTLICPYCQAAVDPAEVAQRMQADKRFALCQECEERVALPGASEPTPPPPAQQRQVDQAQAQSAQRVHYEAALVHLRRLAGERPAPSCFISYAWGDPAHERWVRHHLAPDLKGAGIAVRLDAWHNANVGASIPRFVESIDGCDFAIVAGTPAYLTKYEQRESAAGSVASAEMDLINTRLTGTATQKESVLPLLREGTPEKALPTLLRGRVYADFRTDLQYLASLFGLVRTLYGVPAEAVSQLQDELEADAADPDAPAHRGSAHRAHGARPPAMPR